MKNTTQTSIVSNGNFFRGLMVAVTLLLCTVSHAQLFQQQFTTSTVVADYANATTPNNGQFNAISTSGSGVVLSINTTTSNKLRFARATANAGAFSRTSDFSPTPGSMLYRFDIAVSGNTVAQTSAGTLQVGSGYGTANSSEANLSTHSRLGVNWTATAGQFSLRNLTGSTNTANYTGTQTVLWAINNSGATLTYKAPDGTYETVADDTYDLWIGTTKEFNDIAATTTSISLTDLKFAISNGTGNIDFDNVLIDPIPAVPTSSAATAIGSAGFTANWATVSGVTGYRVDVATDAAFTSMVSGYNNLYVSGQATNSLNVTGLSQTTTYYYRVRGASQYTVGEFAGANSSSQTLTTISSSGIDGVISANEYGTHTNGNNQQSSASGTWYMNWDNTNLYIGITGTNTAEGAVLYLDKNPITPVNGGTNSDGNLVGNTYDGSNFANLQFRADLVVYFKDGYREYRTADGSGGWSTATTAFGNYASASGTREVSIPWSALGGMPSAFNWFGHVAYTGGGAYASVPTENPGSAAGTIIGSSARWDRYYTVSTTTIGSATPPFSRNSYTFTSASDVTGFGSISAYDFTMNSSGRFVSRTGNVTGNWTIGGNLTIGAGTIYLGSGGSGYGTTSVAGNLNLLGGTYDMDATTATTSVTGNVTIASGATLKLSTQVGGDLNVAGNWSNSGTFTPSSRLVQFNGTLAQTLTGATTFDYLTLNNSLGLTLINSITANQTLALTSGKITLGANNLTVGSAGSITSSSTNYIVTNGAGQLKRTIGASAVTFPVGNSAYNPIILNNTGGTSDVYGINVLDGTYATPFDATKVVNRRWQISEAVAGGSNLSVVGQYNTADTFGANFAAGTTPLIGFYNATNWTTVGATAAGANPFTYTSTANITPSDLTTGTQYIGLGKDNAFVSLATKFVITSISPATPSATDAFSVTVQAQDAYNLSANVVAGTAFTLSTNGNAGAIGGTITGTILAGTNSITVSGVTLATAGTGVTLTATRTSGDTLTAGTSSTFTVLGAPTQLVFVGVPATGNAGVNLASFTVEVRRADNSVDTNYVGSVVLTKATGTGNLSGTTSATVVSGVATFNAVQFDNASTFTLNANSVILPQATSGNIVISFVPASIFANVITGTTPGLTSPYTTGQTFNSNITVSGIVRGPGLTGSNGNDRYNASAWSTTTFDANDYFEFTLTPNTGYQILLSSFVYTGQASSGTPTLNFRSSVDNYTANIGSPTTTGTTISLSAAAYQNLTGAITFRMYGYGFAAGTTTFSINDFIFNGNVVCMQPTAYAVTGGGDFCPSGSGVAIGLANSQTGVSYQLKIGGVDTGSPVAGTGSAISFGLQTTAGTYTVVGTNGNAPCNLSTTMSGSAILATATTTSTDGGTSWSNGTPTSGKAVVFDGGTGTISSDVSGCTLRLTNNASVTVASGTDITLSGAITVDSGSTFTLNNNANLLQAGTANSNSGNIVVKRNSSALKRLDYTLWSSPVTGQGLYAFSPFTFGNRFYVYRTNTNLYNNADVGFSLTSLNSDGVNGTDSANVQFAQAKGYLIRMPWDHPTAATVWNGQFTGVPNNGDINFTMTDGGAGQRFNLVGNPYPSPISMTQFVSDNSANITGTLYFWRETNANTSNNAYCSWAGGTFVSNNQAQVVNPNGIIRTGQGFFVEASGAGTTLSFKNGQRSGDNANQFFKTGNVSVANEVTDANRFWLNLTNAAGDFSQMAAGYMANATDGVDIYDGKNINTGSVLLNSVLDATDYTIQGKALPFNTSDVIPLSCKITNAGQYTIAIDHVDGLFADTTQPIILKDNLTSTEHNLQLGAYDFASEAGTFANRFEIIYQSQLGVENPTFNANNVVVYNQNNGFAINSGKAIMSSVKVFDIRGRLIEEKKGINSNQTTLTGGLSNEVLLVQITSEDGVTVTKKVIR